jgi:hypothetical protein
MKIFVFLQQFCNRSHDENEILDETSIKLHHAIENLSVFGGFRFLHVDNGYNFFRIR